MPNLNKTAIKCHDSRERYVMVNNRIMVHLDTGKLASYDNSKNVWRESLVAPFQITLSSPSLVLSNSLYLMPRLFNVMSLLTISLQELVLLPLMCVAMETVISCLSQLRCIVGRINNSHYAIPLYRSRSKISCLSLICLVYHLLIIYLILNPFHYQEGRCVGRRRCNDSNFRVISP